MIRQGASWIDISIYARPRSFHEPFLKLTEVVGVQSCLWTFFFGPFLFWKKGARGLALLMVLSFTPLLHHFEAAPARISIGLSEAPYLSALLWAAWVVMAPVLLVLHYRRKGWVEIP